MISQNFKNAFWEFDKVLHGIRLLTVKKRIQNQGSLFFFGLLLFLSFSAFSQDSLKLIITSVNSIDYRTNKGEKYYLVQKHYVDSIEYNFLHSCKCFQSQNYVHEEFSSFWDGEKRSRDKSSRRVRKNVQRLSEKETRGLIENINTDIKSDNREDGLLLHTSHHYLNVAVFLIQNRDTHKLFKTKPFLPGTSWLSNQKSFFYNPKVDSTIYGLMPEKFVGRQMFGEYHSDYRLVRLREEAVGKYSQFGNEYLFGNKGNRLKLKKNNRYVYRCNSDKLSKAVEKGYWVSEDSLLRLAADEKYEESLIGDLKYKDSGTFLSLENLSNDNLELQKHYKYGLILRVRLFFRNR